MKNLLFLHLEDSPRDRILVEELVRSEGVAATFRYADTREEFERALQERPDLVLADYNLPGFDGISALRIVRQNDPILPFIFVTGSMGEERAIQTFKEGANDYVLKDRMSRLPQAVGRALRDAAEVRKAREAETQLKEQGMLLANAHDAILVCNLDGTIRYWNKGAENLYGWTATEVTGKQLDQVLITPGQSLMAEAKRQVMETERWSGELVKFNRTGARVVVESSWSLVKDDNGQPASILLINTDVSEKKDLEERFLRAQRMQSIGILSGGIAHDLNNVLAPVLLGAQLLRMDLQDDRALKLLDTIETAALHGAELIKQILAFARGVEGKRVHVKLDAVVAETQKLLCETIPRSIVIETHVPDDLWPISAVPAQLTQVLMNLCVNARDAMPQGGELRIHAENILIDENDQMIRPEATVGPYVALTVSDTGMGISPENLDKLYQPFFTTKDPGKGTGLGLSTVQSIVKNHGGFIHIYSEPGKGSTFKCYFPATASPDMIQESIVDSPPISCLAEQILVVEDEEGVRHAIRMILEHHGYRVMMATNGADGLACYRRHRNEIDLVISDIIMPAMDGTGMIHALLELDPEVKIMVVSGLLETHDLSSFVAAKGIETVTKPFGSAKLLQAIENALHGPGRKPPASR